MNKTHPVMIPGLEHLSWSRIQSYLGCSLKWKFHYVDKLKPAFTAAALAFGVAMHEAIEEALAGRMVGVTPPVPELVAIVERSLDEQHTEVPIQYADEGGREAMLELATRMLTAWTEWKRPEARILAVEHSFELALSPGIPPLVGRIDAVEEFPDHILVLDVKTSAKKWSAQQLDEHAPQLVIYAEAVRQLSAELGKPLKIGFEVITKTKIPTVERYVLQEAPEAIGRQTKIAEMVVRAVETGNFIPTPGWQCATCPYASACRDWGKS